MNKILLQWCGIYRRNASSAVPFQRCRKSFIPKAVLLPVTIFFRSYVVNTMTG